MQLSCVWVSVKQLLELFHCCKRASAELQSLLPLFIVIGHMCNESGKCNRSTSSGKAALWRSRQEHTPWSGLWPLIRAHIPELCHIHPCVAPRVAVCRIHTLMHNVQPARCRHLQIPRKDTVRRFHVSARLACFDLQGQALRQQ